MKYQGAVAVVYSAPLLQDFVLVCATTILWVTEGMAGAASGEGQGKVLPPDA